MKKIVKRGQEARDALKRGIDLVADSVKITLGPSGRNVVIGRLNIPPIITNDGVTIARNIEADDPTENLGVSIVKEAASLADAKGGDGTTTATVLTQAFINSLFEKIKDDGSLITKKVDSIKLKKEFDALIDTVVQKLKDRARPITKKDIYDVALVSGEYEWLAKIVADVFEAVGVTGYVNIEEAVKTDFEVFKGLKLAVGFSSEYFYTNDKRECELYNPYVLVTNQRLEIQPIVNLIESLPKDGVEDRSISIILIAPDYSLDVVKRMIATKLQFGLTIIPLKLPTYDKDDILLDIATLTEAQFLDKNTFLKGEDFIKATNFGQLGQIEKAVIGEDTSVLIGGNGDTKGRVKEIKKVYDKTESQFDRDRLEQRMAHLSGGFATIRIGGESEAERTYFKLKTEDAVNAVQEALKDGVVKGGGLALKEIAEELGETIVSKPLMSPYFQIQENSGGTLEILDSVIDPVKITISSLRSAASLASTVATTEVTIAYAEDSIDTNHD